MRTDAKTCAPVFIASGQPRILCATDLSEPGYAVQRAVLLAQQLRAELLLLHVVDGRQLHQVIELQVKRARSALEPLIPQRASLDAPTVAICIRVGDSDKTIANVAQEWQADLVVLGAYRKRPGDRFLGTTSERVARATIRPVLVASGEAKAPYQSVLLASDLSDEFVQLAHMTQQLGLLESARVSLMHAFEPLNASVLYAAGITEPDITRHRHSLSQTVRERLLEQIQSAGLDLAEICVTQEHAKPFRAIERTVADMRPQLLVMGMSHHTIPGRLLSGSVLNEVLRKIECDVLIASPAAARHVRSVLGNRSAQEASVKPGTASSPQWISGSEVIQ